MPLWNLTGRSWSQARPSTRGEGFVSEEIMTGASYWPIGRWAIGFIGRWLGFTAVNLITGIRTTVDEPIRPLSAHSLGLQNEAAQSLHQT
jgi:hypothetical protein